MDSALVQYLRSTAGPGVIPQGDWVKGLIVPRNSVHLVNQALSVAGIKPALRKLPRRLPAGLSEYPDLPPQTIEGIEAALNESELFKCDDLKPGEILTQRGIQSLYNHQNDTGVHTVANDGGWLWHAAGAGKTREYIIWALSRPGPVVIVTKAGVRPQFADDIREVANIEPWYSSPTRSGRLYWEAPWEYWVRCIRTGQRPVFIFGWEELQSIVYKTNTDFVTPAKPFPWEADKSRAIIPDGWNTTPWEAIGVNETLPLCDALDIAATRKRTRKASPYGFFRSIFWTSLVWDETHLGKSHDRTKGVMLDKRKQYIDQKNRASACAWLAARSLRVLGGTGTWQADNRSDLWGQGDLCDPSGINKRDGKPAGGGYGFFWPWAFRYCGAYKGKHGPCYDVGSETNAEELWWRYGLKYTDERKHFFTMDGKDSEQTAPWPSFVHYVPESESHRNLPDKVRQAHRIEVGDLDKGAKFSRSGAELVAGKILGDTVHTKKDGIFIARLAYWAGRKRKPVLAAMDEQLASTQNKLVVFTGLVDDAIAWGKLLESEYGNVDKPETLIVPGKNGGAPSRRPGIKIWVAHGGVSIEERFQMASEYSGKGKVGVEAYKGPCVLVATTESMGTGMNLQDADHVHFCMLPWSPITIQQAENRFHRGGQMRVVFLHYWFITGTEEELVIDCVRPKMESSASAGGGETVITMVEDLEPTMLDGATLAETVWAARQRAEKDSILDYNIDWSMYEGET